MSLDRAAAILAGFAILGLVAFLLVRNEPIASDQLFFTLRVLISLSAATLGATLPGFLNVTWKAGGLAVRAGGALALFVLSFVFTPNLAHSEPNIDKSSQTGVSGNVNAGHDVVINVTRYEYLSDKYLDNGMLRDGWYGVKEDNLQREKQHSNPTLSIFPIGNVEHHLGFELYGGVGGSVILDNLYLKLNSYENCDRRDERNEILGYVGRVSKAYFISVDYDVYPITPLTPTLQNSVWVYKAGESDVFNLYVKYDPYVLYSVSIVAEYHLANESTKSRVESNAFALIDVAHGNYGGCLDVSSWFDKTKQQLPTHNNYDGQMPFDIYSLLTQDFSGDPGAMNIFLNSKYLAQREEEIKQIVDRRPKNTIFARNYKIWKDALAK